MSLAWAGVRSPQLAVGTLGIAAASGGLLGLAVLLPYVMRDLHVRPAAAALVMPAAYVGCSATSVLGGKAADRWGGARVAVLGLTVMALGALLASRAEVMPAYVAAACVTGLGYGIVNPATSVMVDPGSGGGRGLLLSVKQAGVTFGGAASGLLLPAAAEHSGWPLALVAVAVLQLLPATVMLRLRRAAVAPAPVPGSAPTPAPTLAPTPAAVDGRGYRLAPNPGSLYGLTMAGAQITGFGLLTVYLTDRLHVGEVLAGLVFGGVLAVAVGARVVWGLASDRRPADRSRPLQACAVLGAVGFALLAVPSPAAVTVAVLLVGGGAAAWNGAYLAAVMSSGTSGQGAAVGRALLMINVGCIAGPLLGSAVLALVGSWSVLWLTMAAAQALGLVAVTRATVTSR